MTFAGVIELLTLANRQARRWAVIFRAGLALSLAAGFASAQDLDLPPIHPSTPADTVQDDTAAVDTVAESASLDSILLYSANRIKFTFEPRATRLNGDAKIHYRAMELEAALIEVHWNEDILYATDEIETSFQSGQSEARGIIDSSQVNIDIMRVDSASVDSAVIISSRSLLGATDSAALKSQPVKMIDGAQVVLGRELTYNMKTRRGVVIEGVTDYQDGKYRGGRIKKTEAEVYNIRSGYFTTCSDSSPHYTFWSRDMKLRVKDKVVARPVVLQFGPVPVAIIPFGVFPARGGRRSGIIVPTYGESSGQGRYFTNLGYYYAPNDYWDAKALLDYYERYGILLRGDLYYAQRYRLKGGLSGSYVNQHHSGRLDKRWDLKIDHSQELSPSANLNVNAYFASDNSFLQDYSRNLAQRLKQTFRSDATLSKRWLGTPYSGTLNLHHAKLPDGSIIENLPNITFNRSQAPLFPVAEGVKPDELKWFNKMYYNYSGQALNRHNINVMNTTRYEQVGDSLVRIEAQSRVPRTQTGAQHNISLTASTKPLTYFALTPRLTYTEVWFDEWFDFIQRVDGSIDTIKTSIYNPRRMFNVRRTFSSGIGLSTRLYGLFYPRLFGIEAIRHTIAPNLGFTYVPDFSQAKWDYYRIFIDTLGRRQYYDRFGGGLFGATPRHRQENLNLGVDNLFEYKRLKDDKEVKGELFSLGLSTAHNFAADSLRWSNLSSGLRIKPLGESLFSGVSGLGMDFSAAHSFYAVEKIDVGVGRVFYRTVNKPAPRGLRLLSFDMSTSLKLAGGKGSASAKADTSGITAGGLEANRFQSAVWSPSSLPWTVGFTFRYGESRPTPAEIRRDVWSALNMELQATKNWRLNGDMRFDHIRKQIASTTLSIYRDLHCWQGSFTWNPLGAYRGYYLNISIKSAQLHDVKVEKREGSGGFFGF